MDWVVNSTLIKSMNANFCFANLEKLHFNISLVGVFFKISFDHDIRLQKLVNFLYIPNKTLVSGELSMSEFEPWILQQYPHQIPNCFFFVLSWILMPWMNPWNISEACKVNNQCSSLSCNLPACFVKDCFGSSENHTTIVNCKLDHKQNLHNGGNLGRSEKLYIVWYSTQLKWSIKVIHF